MYFPRTSSSPSKNISLAFNKNGIKVMHLVPKSKTFYAHLFMQKHKVHIILFSWRPIFQLKGFPGGSVGKESACKAGDQGSIPGSGRSPEEGNGNPLEYSCLENSIDRGAWWATVHGAVTRLSNWTAIALTRPDRGHAHSCVIVTVLILLSDVSFRGVHYIH